MSEVLSQAEIDNLLNALSTGELDTDALQDQNDRQVKNYDFERPAKFSKEHLRTLEIIYEHYGRLLSTNLPVYLRKTVQASVASSETVTFSEFTNALQTPSILGIIDFRPLNGSIILEMSTNLGFSMIDRMLGGTGAPLDKERDFTEIELTILQKMMIICVQLMHDPWKNVVDISPVMERLETNPQFAQVISPTDMVAIVTLNMKIGDVEGFVNVCLPFFTMEAVMDKLNTKYWFTNMQETADEDYTENLEVMLKHVDVPVKAVLGVTSITVAEFTTLQIGDIIKLERNTGDELDVYVGNMRKFNALPGSSKEKYAVRVTEVVREEE
ncbi:MAG: flagellar motor switch protein FliM [Lachnospiraceae bacterium]|nr:flagellar motor switch protein FliM [Lachnospiraceae bacterium]